VTHGFAGKIMGTEQAITDGRLIISLLFLKAEQTTYPIYVLFSGKITHPDKKAVCVV
jgi:hypothetical protein